MKSTSIFELTFPLIRVRTRTRGSRASARQPLFSHYLKTISRGSRELRLTRGGLKADRNESGILRLRRERRSQGRLREVWDFALEERRGVVSRVVPC